jgi:hypothetical protein
MCTTEKKYYQVLTYDQYSCPVLQSWHYTLEEAETAIKNYKVYWPDSEWWVEEGTEYILDKCRECGNPDAQECHDAYGYSTGHWCGNCYENHYPYRKGRYFDEGYAGESLEGWDD